MIKDTKAAILEKIGHPLAVKRVQLPKLLAGQVLVKVLYSGVCRSQLMEVLGGRGEDRWLPHLLGHEGSGIVLQVGAGVSKVAQGDSVILGWLKGEGMDAPGAKYMCEGQIVNSGRVTTFSEYTIVSENRLVKKPDGMPFDVAALYGCALPTGSGMVMNELQPSDGSTIAVLGLGGIGIAALIALRAYSCREIIAIDTSDEKLAFAIELGATKVFNPLRADVASMVRELTGGGVDYCIESAGTTKTIELGFSLIKAGGGQLLFASHPQDGQKLNILPHELISGKKIAGSWGGKSDPDRDIPKMFQLFCESKAPLEKLITKRYRLEQINDALADLEAGKVFRPLVVMDHLGDRKFN